MSIWNFGRAGRRLAMSLAGLLLVCGPAFGAGSQVIRMVPGGSDTGDGSSAASAFGTLQRAVERATSLLSSGSERVEIQVDGGTYSAQKVSLEGVPAGKQLVIRAAQASNRPVFDGAGKGGTWMVITAKTGDVGNVIVSDLQVSNYATAVTMNGSRDAPSPRVLNVELRNNVFQRIGQIAMPGDKPSSAAVRLVNADGVRIVGNRFVEIKNNERCGLLHAIYAAHGSTDGVIENNTFEDSCGDAIRFRDGSGNNRVTRNTFVDAWAKAPITDWYCDSEGREDCTKAEVECPSWNNIVEGNQLRSRSKKKPPAATLTYGADDSSACRERRATSAGASSRFLSR